MNKNKGIVTAAVILGVILIYIGYIYASHSAETLPSFFPGSLAGSNHIHTKHSLASFVVAIGLFIFAWFKSGPKQAI
ncbi:MAG: hypothetical protein JWO40_247 [Candidatus Doudnabacteria bacterium]|nr:hypothetical protein [Candidatus Doudnabacteria bacterium]